MQFRDNKYNLYSQVCFPNFNSIFYLRYDFSYTGERYQMKFSQQNKFPKEYYHQTTFRQVFASTLLLWEHWQSLMRAFPK